MTAWETVALITGALGVGKALDTVLGWLLAASTRRMDLAAKAQRIAGEAVDDLEEQRDRARKDAHECRQILIALLAGKITPDEAHTRARKQGII